MSSSEPRSAVVIGGASGIGAAIARALAADGAVVTVADRNLDLAESIAAELGSPHDAAAVDVVDEDSVRELFHSVRAHRGHVDVVVNSAGLSVAGAVTDLAIEKFRRVVDVCLTGAFAVIKQAARAMDDGGVIISLSSLNARQPGTGMSAYCSAKAGLAMLTQVAALELAERKIRVNAIAPGIVMTPLTTPSMSVPGLEEDYLANTPLGRSGTPEEVAEAAVYMTHASWLTGESLDLNGGAHLARYPDLLGHFQRASAG
ncbi:MULTISPECIES: SDR family NAD(P)-dependent oxidoreductase [Gordonia]|uniref:SDR family NAD(P)-dependent oxidoreductase n=2 Tax=Gordonia terrae TaxID=2055 RepID=A0AAD0KB00_9ACTN|nr:MULTISPECIES: SDR family NAD(P)-dependent oxidoreductase [Gordonia]VTR10535.1 sorbitol-6-phosphate 2-dehydrogenase SrlD [Clostridioides difficile]ANY24155.1 short-chain dehydrogenase [Gordonia terrae]AWO84898.1 SDR family NAD(P)-dependent oxidoreductase [Gordonia terrae]MCG7633614.1 SDR family oxidoreductase [Gordonia sp. McavH-238-E]VTS57350.1 3-oxoacyl-[acyl-carrier-protein] reductase FabG [Gordonia terrae]